MFKKVLAILGAGLLAVSQSVFAALPAGVATTVTAIETNATDIFDLIFPVVGAILGLTIVIKLFKRFTSKV